MKCTEIYTLCTKFYENCLNLQFKLSFLILIKIRGCFSRWIFCLTCASARGGSIPGKNC